MDNRYSRQLLYHNIGKDGQDLISAKTAVIVGLGALGLSNGENVLRAIAKLADQIDAIREDWNGVSVLNTDASTVGGLDIGFVPNDGKSSIDIVNQSDLLFLLGADEVDLSNKKGKIVYIGSHGDYSANYADIILPGATYIEKSGIYVNMEGRPQLTNKVIFAPGQAKEDWSILCSLARYLGIDLPYSTIGELRSAIFKLHPHLANIGLLSKPDMESLKSQGAKYKKLGNSTFRSVLEDFYLSNFIARSSKVMAECSAFYKSISKRDTLVDCREN